MNIFNQKNILLIVPKFYGYEDQIKRALESRGASVNVIFDNLEDLNYFYRFICVYIPRLKPVLCKLFYLSKIKKIDAGMDYVFVVKGSSLTREIVKKIKELFGTSTKYIYYLWDNSNNSPNCIDIAKEFDNVATFDMDDANKFGWYYRPLFFVPCLCTDKERNIDMLYTGAIHSKRTYIMEKVKKYAEINHLTAMISMYSKKVVYYKRKYINRRKEYRILKQKDVTFTTLSVSQMYNLYSRTKVIVDYTHPDQTGLTMRTIESIGNSCKLLTNNACIKNMDFYNQNNIYIYDDEFDIPKDFINKPFEAVESKIIDRYTIDSWINDIFGDYL